MQNPGVRVVEVVEDDALKSKEELATEVFRRSFPNSPPVKLYRTSGGKVGMKVAMTLSENDFEKFDEAYRAVIQAISQPQ